MNSKGQFYIIASVVIAVILASLITIVNYVVTKPEPVKFYDLTKQLNYETTNIINYGVVTNDTEIDEKINQFIKEDFLPYVKQKDPNIELIYIYGNGTDATIVNLGNESIFTENQVIKGGLAGTSSTISIDIGGERAEKTIVQASRYFQPFTLLLKPSKTVTIYVDVNGKRTGYDFILSGKQQFFAIMTAKKEGEVYVSKTGTG